MQEYLAIDNVCAWPNLTILPNGEIAAILFNQPCHGKWEGCVECWISKDSGVSWEFRSKAVPNESGTNRMNHAAGMGQNKDIIVICGGWDNIPATSDPQSDEIRNFDRQKCSIIKAAVGRSSDNGLTWSYEGEVIEGNDHFSHLVPYGDILPISDEVLGCCFYDGKIDYVNNDNRGSAYLLKSYDDGTTWQDPVRIGEDLQNETFFFPVTSEHLIAASRSFIDMQLDYYKSFDAGKSWERSYPQLTGPGQAPAHIMRLSSGELLLTFGIRARGLYGIGARFSEDDGGNWGSINIITSMGNAYDGGYPSTIELEDGSLVTAYYSGPNESHNRYHMKTIAWTLEEAVRKNKDTGKTQVEQGMK
ncbi:MAG: sialidase family protein [Planctomycetota bacterium]|jgi:hypothetical protein